MKKFKLLSSGEEDVTERFFYVDPAAITGVIHNPAAEGCGVIMAGLHEPIGVAAHPDEVIEAWIDAKDMEDGLRPAKYDNPAPLQPEVPEA